jgi:hypothetical protein
MPPSGSVGKRCSTSRISPNLLFLPKRFKKRRKAANKSEMFPRALSLKRLWSISKSLKIMNLVLCLVLLLAPCAFSSERNFHLVAVPRPLKIEVNDGILVSQVPVMMRKVSPEANFMAITFPFGPPSTAPNQGVNVNLASLAGIVISPKLTSNTNDYLVVIDY